MSDSGQALSGQISPGPGHPANVPARKPNDQGLRGHLVAPTEQVEPS